MKDLLAETAARAARYLGMINERSVAPLALEIGGLKALAGPLPEDPSDPAKILALLDDAGSQSPQMPVKGIGVRLPLVRPTLVASAPLFFCLTAFGFPGVTKRWLAKRSKCGTHLFRESGGSRRDLESYQARAVIQPSFFE